MRKIEALEHAKRKAAASYARMCTQQHQQQVDVEAMQQATTRDEQDVLRARVDVLNTLMRAPDVRLCLESDNHDTDASNRRKRVCVTYDRMRCSEGELELGPMQSTMSWVVRGGEDPILHLLSAGDGGAHAPVVKGLLELIKQSAPKKDTLQRLHEVLSLPAPERLVLKSVVGLNAAREDHTRVIEGLGEKSTTATPVPPLYRVTWGALDLDVLEGWQNPSTNAAIRRSILDTAHQAVREAERTKAPAWSNVSYMQVRIFHADECHVLSLRPFRDSESCTVSHLQYRQSVFDDDVSGPERGILNLTQKDPADIHAIPMGTILPLQAYVCLGAHRKSRLNEAQLNYVHAQGLLAHPGLDVKLLPDAASLMLPIMQHQTRKMVPAKSTRISADKLDVVASSYHVADQVYTTISVVQYPPFGTQFEKRAVVVAPAVKAKKSVNMRVGAGEWGDEDGEPEEFGPGYMERFARENDIPYDPRVDPYSDQYVPGLDPDYDQSDDENDTTPEADTEPVVREVKPNWTDRIGRHHPAHPTHYDKTGEKQTRGVREDQDKPLYKVGRDFNHDNIPRSKKQIRQSARPGNWDEELMEGEHYFVDGVIGNPYILAKRFILFELDNGNRYKQAEERMNAIKTFYKLHRNAPWKSQYTFYWNILKNHDREHADDDTIGNTWRNQWKEFIKTNMIGMKEALLATDRPPWFWYTEDEQQWHVILKDDPSFATQYIAFARKYHADLVDSGHISTQNLSRRNTQQLASSSINQIPLPPRNQTLSARNKLPQQQAPVDPALSKLQTRIDALETRLSRVRQEENTKHLLHMVLDRLDTLEEITEVV